MKCTYLFSLPIFLVTLCQLCARHTGQTPSSHTHLSFTEPNTQLSLQTTSIKCVWNLCRAPKQQLNKIALLFVNKGQCTTAAHLPLRFGQTRDHIQSRTCRGYMPMKEMIISKSQVFHLLVFFFFFL